MGKNDRRFAYGICVLAVTAILLTVISHSGHARREAGPKEGAKGLPWKEAPASAAAVPPGGHDSPSQGKAPLSTPAEEAHSSVEHDAGPAPRPQSTRPEASPVSQTMRQDFSAPAAEEPPSTDSDQSMSQPQESASQRVARRLRGH